MKLVILDYGMGNLRSVQKAFERLGTPATISSDKNVLQQADKIILPGVGHFKKGMEHLHSLDIIELLSSKIIQEKTPVLGICLGMQLMTNHSEEGDVKGLEWVNATTKKFQFNSNNFRIPHIGWNNLEIKNGASIFHQIGDKDFFYFVHSYYVTSSDDTIISTTSNYGGTTFISAFQKNNIFGMQYHPEKSHDQGLKLLKNFIEY